MSMDDRKLAISYLVQGGYLPPCRLPLHVEADHISAFEQQSAQSSVAITTSAVIERLEEYLLFLSERRKMLAVMAENRSVSVAHVDAIVSMRWLLTLLYGQERSDRVVSALERGDTELTSALVKVVARLGSQCEALSELVDRLRRGGEL